MNFQTKTLDWAQAASLSVDALLVLVPEKAAVPASAKDPLSQMARQALAAGDLSAGAKTLSTYRLAGVRAPRVVFVFVSDGSATQLRQTVTSAMAAIKQPGVKHVGVVLSLMRKAELAALQSIMMALSDATYSYTDTKPSAKPRELNKVTLGLSQAPAAKLAFEQALATVRGVELAKEWANRPGNHATPTRLAEAAKALGRPAGFSTEVLGPKEVAKLGMGAFMAVAQGSAEPLRFIVLRYNGAARTQAPVVLVGKGITFDTGGISIKPAGEMDEMKFDMGGAASVLGVFEALAHSRPKINVVGLIPSCENMPDGLAVKPGDVVTSMSGQTIEVLNTDAEGRLILCDALTYAKRFKPHSVIDVATLTGACVIALGAVRSGLFSGDDALAQALSQAGERSHDLCWRMPLDDAYAEGLKSNFADMGNIAGRAAGSITAAKFLQKFTTDMRWAHLDIAGTAWRSGAAKGSTGRPVPLLHQYLLDVASGQAKLV
jgi:leucyl aminopeptidase